MNMPHVIYLTDEQFERFMEAVNNPKEPTQKLKDMLRSSPPWQVQNAALKANCEKCGLDLTKAMGFVCGAHECPTYPRVTC